MPRRMECALHSNTNGHSHRERITGKLQLLSQDDTSDVFLGGSCNPTTWRTDIVIPIFEGAGISFFNPQASCASMPSSCE